MKFQVLSLLVLSSLFSATSFGMSRGLPKIEDESIYDASVEANFNLRATDGSVIKFTTPVDLSGAAMKVLPAERNADYSKCDNAGKIDTDLFLKVNDISIQLLQQKRSLTSAEVAVIQKTPRCSPYTAALQLIASILSPQPSVAAEAIKSLTLQADKKAGNFLLVNTDSGKSAAFKISSDLKSLKIRELRDFTQVQILASQSGQNAGIKFSLEDISEDTPTHSREFESCEYTHTERQCRYDHEKKEDKCDYVTITEPGERRVHSTTQFTNYSLRIDIVDLQNRVLATGKVMDGEFNTDKDYGSCLPIGGDRHGRDDRDRRF